MTPAFLDGSANSGKKWNNIVSAAFAVRFLKAIEPEKQAVIYVPLIYNQPPECAWIPSTETDYPTIIAGNYGRGRVVYFANQTDKLCFTNGHEDFMQTYENAVRCAACSNFSMTTDAPGSVHIHLLKRGKGASSSISFL